MKGMGIQEEIKELEELKEMTMRMRRKENGNEKKNFTRANYPAPVVIKSN